MSNIKVFLSIFLSVCLIFVPFSRLKVSADPVISSFVIGLFLSVCLALGFHFDISIADISAWAEAKIQSYLNANGYGSVSAWLGANFESEATVSGSFLGLTPNLWAKLKLAVEASIGSGSDDLPTGGTVSEPVTRSLLSNYYLPCTITIPNVGTYTGDYPVLDYGAIANRQPDFRYTNQFSYGYKYAYNAFPISFPLQMTTQVQVPFTIVSNSVTYNFSYFINNTYTVNSPKPGALSIGDPSTDSNSSLRVPINSFDNRAFYADTLYNAQLAFIPKNGSYQNLIPVFIYHSINGYDYLMYPANFGITIPAFSTGTGSITAYGVGIPQYTFNNADLIYIDLQLGNLNTALQALIALIAALNDNLVTWTIAIQSNSPSDLPEDTTSLIDYVDYCNEQTNLYLSGTSSLAACVGNMYTELYNTLSIVSSSQISTALINTYNAFLSKMTLYSSSMDPGGTLSSVQQFQTALFSLTGTYAQKFAAATSLLDTYISNATGIQETIALYNAYTSYCDTLGYQINLVTDIKSSINQMNAVVDRYLNGTVDASSAMTTLLTLYKNGISNAKSGDQLAAVVAAYQACVDRISLDAFSVDPEGLGDTADDVIQLEDDLISHIDLDALSAMFDFQNWTYINSQEGSLYREFFQKIMNSNSPFYLFIYVPMILGIVSIVLGTRVTLPHKVKASRDDSISRDPKYDRYHSDYTGRGA